MALRRDDGRLDSAGAAVSRYRLTERRRPPWPAQRHYKRRRRTMKKLLAGSILAFGLALSPAWAGTPKDTLVVAKAIDDMITLDPAETFELSGGELISNL